MGIGNGSNSGIGNSNAEDVSSKIFNGLFPVSDGLAMDVPSAAPLFWFDGGIGIQAADQFFEFSAEDLGKSFYRQEEILSVNSSSRDDNMEMRMIL